MLWVPAGRRALPARPYSEGVSTTPEPEPEAESAAAHLDASDAEQAPAPSPAESAAAHPDASGAEQAPAPSPAERPAAARPAAKLIFDDPLNQQSSDDTDRGWGERPAGGGSAADLARFLDEKPPHHL